MVNLSKEVLAGTLESGDIMIRMKPGSQGSGIIIDLESSIKDLMGDQIENEIKEIITKFEITDVVVHAIDKGALGCTVRARTTTAARRGLREVV